MHRLTGQSGPNGKSIPISPDDTDCRCQASGTHTEPVKITFILFFEHYKSPGHNAISHQYRTVLGGSKRKCNQKRWDHLFDSVQKIILVVKIEWDNKERISFFAGVALLSLINIALITANLNQYLFNWYILGISIIVIIIIMIIMTRLSIP